MKAEYTVRERKTREQLSSSSKVADLIGDKLEQVARDGAQRMLAEMLEAEVGEFLQRVRYHNVCSESAYSVSDGGAGLT